MKNLIKKVLPPVVVGWLRWVKKNYNHAQQRHQQQSLKALQTSRWVQEFINKQLASYPLSPLDKGSGELTTVLTVSTSLGNGGSAVMANTLQRQVGLAGLTSYTLVHRHSIPLQAQQSVIPRQQSVYWQSLREQAKQEGLIDLIYPESFELVHHPYYEAADVLHLHDIEGDYFSLLALPLVTQNKPTVWTLHSEQAFTGHCAVSLGCERWKIGCGQCPNLGGYPPVKQDNTAYLWQLKKQAYANSRFTAVVPSQWLYDRVKQSPLFKGKDVRLIYNGVDLEVFKVQDKTEARKALGLPLDKKMILFSADGGAKNPWKGGSIVYDLYNQITDKSGLLFVNLGGAKEEKEAWLATPYIHDRAELAQWYAAADVMLYPSLADSFGLVVAEAMACGLPVVTFATGGIPELVEHLESGYVAAYKDSEELMTGLQLFLNDDELRGRASAQARATAEAKFDEKIMIRQYLELYKELTTGDNP